MSADKKNVRSNVARSYRFDPETLGLLGRLGEAMRDPRTGQPRSQTDILREGVRALAKKYLPREENLK